MRNPAISLSSPHPFSKPSRPSPTRTSLSHPSSTRHHHPTTTTSPDVVLPPSLLQLPRSWNGVSYFACPKKKHVFKPRATGSSLTETAGDGGKAGSSIMKTLELGVWFGLWYLFNISFNIYDKQVLKVYPYPWTITLIHFARRSVLVLLLRIANLYRRPRISPSQLLAVLPLAVAHTLGTIFLNMSLGKVAVSFTHTIKALQPIFTVVLSAIFHPEFPTPWVVASLFPIVGGVALASATEASFNWAGFWSAMASNLTNQSRNVLSKNIMVKKGDSPDNITLFSVITIMSSILQFPATYLEGFKFTPAYFNTAAQQGMDVKLVLVKSLLAGLYFHAYQQEENIVKGVREIKQRHVASFLNTVEKGVEKKLCEKDLEIENINRQIRELEEKFNQVSMDLQSWHYRAKYNESVVNVLKTNLQQVMAQGAMHGKEGFGDSEVDDAASYINQNHLGFGDGSGSSSRKSNLNCKACKIKEVSVLLVPCRHLCLCKDCEGSVDICPVCQVMKTASVQVYMS